MRIISPFKDYYDNIQAYGIEESLNFIREPKKHIQKLSFQIKRDKDIIPLFWPYEHTNQNDYVKIEYIIIGFCGHWHLCVKITENKETQAKFLYSFEEYEAYRKQTKNLALIDHYNARWNSFFVFDNPEEPIGKKLKSTFNKVKYLNDISTFQWYEAPIIIVTVDRSKAQKTFTANGSLREYKFEKVKDPYTAYQEISMFVSGVLGHEEDHPSLMSDDVMRDKKGFDNWSFKTKPGTKKPRKKQK